MVYDDFARNCDPQVVVYDVNFTVNSLINCELLESIDMSPKVTTSHGLDLIQKTEGINVSTNSLQIYLFVILL